MTAFLLTIHVIVCFAVVLVVLLQAGKGADLGATFGGASQTVFGGRGAAGFLTKVTAVAGALFMITSLMLALTMSSGTRSSVVQEPTGKKAAMPQGAMPSMPSRNAPANAAPAMPAAPAAPAPRAGK